MGDASEGGSDGVQGEGEHISGGRGDARSGKVMRTQ